MISLFIWAFLVWARSKYQSLCWIKDRVWKKLQGWKECLLSQAGKEVLIKAVIQAIPSYVMSIIKFPKGFYVELSSMVARFWWSNKDNRNGMHWVNCKEYD